jgi:hypothetical protein
VDVVGAGVGVVGLGAGVVGLGAGAGGDVDVEVGVGVGAAGAVVVGAGVGVGCEVGADCEVGDGAGVVGGAELVVVVALGDGRDVGLVHRWCRRCHRPRGGQCRDDHAAVMPLGHVVRPGLVAYRTPAFEMQLSVWPTAVVADDAGLAPAVAS